MISLHKRPATFFHIRLSGVVAAAHIAIAEFSSSALAANNEAENSPNPELVLLALHMDSRVVEQAITEVATQRVLFKERGAAPMLLRREECIDRRHLEQEEQSERGTLTCHFHPVRIQQHQEAEIGSRRQILLEYRVFIGFASDKEPHWRFRALQSQRRREYWEQCVEVINREWNEYLSTIAAAQWDLTDRLATLRQRQSVASRESSRSSQPVINMNLSRHGLTDQGLYEHLLASMMQFTFVAAIDLSYNRLRTTSVLPPLPQLTALDISSNELADSAAALTELKSRCPRIQNLKLMPNPCCPSNLPPQLWQNYRGYVVAVLPALVSLDGAPVVPNDRSVAQRFLRV